MFAKRFVMSIVLVTAALLSQPGTAVSQSETIVSLGGAVGLEAVVVGIDRVDRSLLLLGPKENVVAVEVGYDVRNFDQIMIGDKVRVKYYESVALYIDFDGNAPEPGAELVTATASTEDAAAAVVVETVDVTARVWATDHSKRTLKIKMHDGRMLEVKVDKSVEIYPRLKKGDVVHIRHTEAVAVSVTPY